MWTEAPPPFTGSISGGALRRTGRGPGAQSYERLLIILSRRCANLALLRCVTHEKARRETFYIHLDGYEISSFIPQVLLGIIQRVSCAGGQLQ